MLAKNNLVFLVFRFHAVNTVNDVIDVEEEGVKHVHFEFILEFFQNVSL